MFYERCLSYKRNKYNIRCVKPNKTIFINTLENNKQYNSTAFVLKKNILSFCQREKDGNVFFIAKILVV